MHLRAGAGAVALHAAARYGFAAVVRELLSAGAEPSPRDANSWTPLQTAVSQCDEPIVRLLLEARAKVEVADRNGYRPLHQAARAAAAQILRELLAAGADAAAITTDGQTALHIAITSLGSLDQRAPCVTALLEGGAPLDLADNATDRPIHLAARTGQLELIRSLLAAGCNPGPVDGAGNTPLHLCANQMLTAGIDALLCSGADPDAQQSLGEYNTVSSRSHRCRCLAFGVPLCIRCS